jgi:hypothetical protein
MNMSYCRFQNTVSDLRDCTDNMDDSDLSYDELIARRGLIKLAVEIADNYRDEIEDHLPTRAEYEALADKNVA